MHAIIEMKRQQQSLCFGYQEMIKEAIMTWFADYSLAKRLPLLLQLLARKVLQGMLWLIQPEPKLVAKIFVDQFY